jgi:DNA-binding SARP family transcriptional activator
MGSITQHAIDTWLAMLAGDRERCASAADRATTLAREWSIDIWTPQVLGNRLACAIGAGEHDAVRRYGDDYGALDLEGRPVDLAYRHCILAWRSAASGDAALAQRHQSAAAQIAQQVGMPFLEALSQLGVCHILFMQGDAAGARRALEAAHDIARREGLGVVVFGCLLARARLAASQGNGLDGDAELRAAFAMGRRQGYSCAYWWDRAWVADLAVQALRAGIEVPYVQSLVRRCGLTPRAPPLDCPSWPWRIRLFTLGRLQLVVDDHVVPFAGKAQRRPLELLLAVIAFRGREVPEERLFEALWPGSEPDRSYASLKMAASRLRQILGDADALRLSHGCLTLDAHRCWVDSWELERRLSASEAALREGDADSAYRSAEAALALYRGPFMQGDASPWSLDLRERLNARLCRTIVSLGEALVDADQDGRAITLHERALQADPLAEALYCGLVRIHLKRGRTHEATEAFDRCSRLLAAHGLPLSRATEAVRPAR